MEMNYNKILTDEDFMEIKQHGSSDYPFQHYYDELESTMNREIRSIL